MILIQNTLSSMPIYFMSLFRIPRIVKLRLEKIQMDFLWEADTWTKNLTWLIRPLCVLLRSREVSE